MRTFRLLGLVLITMLVSINFAACSDGNEQDDLDPDKNSTLLLIQVLSQMAWLLQQKEV